MDSQQSSYGDLLDLTDTASSSSHTGLFETNENIVLELHDIKKGGPTPQTETAQTDSKKKRRKKRAQPATDKSTTSTSSAASDSGPKIEDQGKEEFYDAKGSVHALPESQAKPAATIVLAQAHSEHGQDPKAPVAERTSATQRQPSTITKPVAPPDS
ncbi:uncharacterized protein LOC110991963 isoform X1 [Pieris rapae]|uniref:uncharacterized protein LOC110991963 isoform X1 n=1 Tax=Pieris rapae TaxID=64459 RepID=UPI000B927DE7|nr:uncharacterized protein LOC110991963 isoform X1 [Pieris rapae]